MTNKNILNKTNFQIQAIILSNLGSGLGLSYKLKNNLRIHLEWVVIMKKYQNRNLSKRLMNDFFNRMSQAGHKIVTVGFYHESFFYKQGFEIDQSFGGLVKNLK